MESKGTLYKFVWACNKFLIFFLEQFKKAFQHSHTSFFVIAHTPYFGLVLLSPKKKGGRVGTCRNIQSTIK
jgi:hypothetical protein